MIPVEFASLNNYEIVELRLKGHLEPIKGYFTSLRVDGRSLPIGMFRYDIRGDDDCGDEPVSINKHVLVNHFGTIITNDYIFFKADEKSGRYQDIEIESLDFCDEYYTPPKVIYTIVYSGYDEFCVHQVFDKWENVVEAFKEYDRRNKLFGPKYNETSPIGFEIVTYPICDSGKPEFEVPKQVRFTASSSGTEMSSTIDMDYYDDDDDMHDKVSVELYPDDFTNDTELVMLIDIDKDSTRESLYEAALDKYAKYRELLMTKGINVQRMIDDEPKIDEAWLVEHGFVKHSDTEYRYYLDGGPNVGDSASV